MSPSVQFAIAVSLLLVVVVGGTMGYAAIEGWPLSDSLYMTVITITTVGYMEVQPLSSQGRIFTIVLIVFSVGTAGYSITTLIGFIFGGQILQEVRGRKMDRAISHLRDHYIICGCGVVGKEVALEFRHAGVPFVVIDQDPMRSELGRDESILFLAGNAEDDDTLIEAGIMEAKGLISALRQDGSNVFVVLTARQLNPDLTIVARAAEEKSINKLIKAGADRVISPYQIGGRRMASVILRPSVMNFLDVVVEGGDVAMRLEEVPVTQQSPFEGKSLGESGIGQHTDAKVIGIQGPDGHSRISQSGTTLMSAVVLQEGDSLIALGSEDQLKSLKAFAGQKV
jgi:voltage-gated potassium channel